MSAAMKPGTVLVAAGGTGGHLFPAQSLAAELGARGWTVDLATDERADTYGGDFPARDTHIISAATLAGRSPVAMVRTVWKLGKGIWQSYWLLRRIGPAAAVGFGGYPTFPPLVAAWMRGIPTLLHEQNAVMGRANRMLAGRVTAIATSLRSVRLDKGLEAKAVHTGNPVRAQVHAAVRAYEPPTPDGEFRLLVFGGSQGARFFSDSVPPAIDLLSAEHRSRLKVVQQCRPEDLDRVRAAYDASGVDAELAAFFPDMPERMAAAHLVVCRSGASSVSELSVIGRPSLLVPLPHALDQDQAENAAVLSAAGGAWVKNQADLDAQNLAATLGELIDDPGKLTATAAAAKAAGQPDAAKRLADLVDHIAGGQPVTALVREVRP